VVAVGALFFVAFIRVGWVSDDAFIAIRSVDNLVNGKGFALNVGERVQSYTSPLWAILNVPVFASTRNPYASLVVTSILCNLALVLILFRGFRAERWKAVACLLACVASSSFLHFSTSGLENPLAHVLVTLFVFERWKQGNSVSRFGLLLAAALVLTRFDYVLLVLPTVVLVACKNFRRTLKVSIPALSLTLAWFGFSTFYYGFPLPNTAYAKLNTSIPFGEQLAQGFNYFVDSVYRDPLVLLVVMASMIAIFRRRMPASTIALGLGIAGYLTYVGAVGGDFMSGRFLTVIYIMSVLLVVNSLGLLHTWSLPGASAALLSFSIPSFSDRRADLTGNDCFVPLSGIVDERACYVEHTGLAQNVRRQKWKTHVYLNDFTTAANKNPSAVMIYDLVGMVSYANVQSKHLVERFGLSEPLLSRIRAPYDPGWRIGHYFRNVPAGYIETLETGKNAIEDPCLHALYERLSPVIHGPLWSVHRLAMILNLNTNPGVCHSP
jgi:arabinofuranosyltransferase